MWSAQPWRKKAWKMSLMRQSWLRLNHQNHQRRGYVHCSEDKKKNFKWGFICCLDSNMKALDCPRMVMSGLSSQWKFTIIMATAPFNNVKTLNFNTQLLICVFTVYCCQSQLWQRTVKIRVQKLMKCIDIHQSQCLDVTFWLFVESGSLVF